MWSTQSPQSLRRACVSHTSPICMNKAITMAEWNRQQRQLENGGQSSDADGEVTEATQES